MESFTAAARQLGRVLTRSSRPASWKRWFWSAALAAAACVGLPAGPLPAAADEAEGLELFEKKIRPVLVRHCYDCHNSRGKAKGGLVLDHRAGLLAGGDSGKVLLAGKPDESILIWALRHENGYEMPAGAPRLDDAVVRDFERWVRLGAPDPRVEKPTAEPVAEALPWEQVREQRRQWWSFQPLADPQPPEVDDSEWAANAIDRFLYDRLRREGLTPQPIASPEILARRLHLILTGLPPRPEVVRGFVERPTDQAYEQLVDDLLASPQFGQRWARHWMDWYRYAETHGSEGDPAIPHAARYRDYLIRALNDDVPYDQLLREHLAGDLLRRPRVNKELEINESAIGPAHLRMVPHGFGVTDAYGEQITFTDNQIDVISKTMLGLTVSCSRCHDHKFDPVSQRDFYRLYGIMVSCRPSTVLIDSPKKLRTNQAELTEVKEQLRARLAEHWLSELGELPNRLEQRSEEWAKLDDPTDPLGVWTLLRQATPESYATRVQQFLAELREIEQHNRLAIENAAFHVDLRDPAQADKWYASGNGSATAVSPAGSFAVHATGEQAVAGIYPAGIYSHLLSDKHAAVLSSVNFTARGQRTFVRAAGHHAQLRVPIRNYPLTHGGLHPATSLENGDTPRWMPTQPKWQYWQGEQVHYELRTSRDIIPRPGNEDRSWFGITEIYAGDQPPRDTGASILTLVDDPSTLRDLESLRDAYVGALRDSITAWRDGRMTDAQARFLDSFVRRGLLANRTDQLPSAARELLERYRKLEAAVPVPTRAPGVLDAQPVDHPLLVRGDYKQEADPVARQFLEVFGGRPYGGHDSGRLQLADDMVSDANTLKSRVLVNRLWAYVFGRGIVPSTDNFGRLGSQPTHPLLLDYLARRFEREGWSIKRALRHMVTSRAFRATSQAPTDIRREDPENVYLSHFTPRRLDAEAIHDSITWLAGNGERAVYLPVIRNRLHPFLATFNAPVPTSTVSQRTNTNVPAQSLAMMNGPLVEDTARAWSGRIVSDERLATPEARVRAMYLQAYGRQPTDDELQLLLDHLAAEPDLATRREELQRRRQVMEEQIVDARRKRDAFLDPVRERLQREIDQRNAAASEQRPELPAELQPLARWDFEGDARDSLGSLHGEIQGDARLEDGALLLNGGCVLTAPLGRPLVAKTLEVLVQLDRLDQRGGGAMTLQTLDGHTFDSIVYGEAIEGRWLAGSNFFRRTLPLPGPAEEEAAERPVRIVSVYEKDGTIRVYRDGKPYAEPYRKNDAQAFARGQAQVAFGLRHGTHPTPGRMLTGRIHEARLYDRALTAEEVAAVSAAGLREVVTRSMLLAALDEAGREQLAEHESRLEQLQASAKRLDEEREALQDRLRTRNQGYYGIAHALLNSKEFIYVY